MTIKLNVIGMNTELDHQVDIGEDPVEERRITLSGKVLDKNDNQIGSTKFFDFIKMPMDKYDHLVYTQEQAHRIKHHILHMKHGMSSFVPLVCFGPHTCKFVRRCPIWLSLPESEKMTRTNAYPIGLQCIMESEFVSAQLYAYCKELEVNPGESPTEMGLVSKLVELDVYDYRANILLAVGGEDSEGRANAFGQDLLIEQTVGVTPQGVEITQKNLHPLIELKDKLHRQRNEILTLLVATRREKYKEKQALRGVVENTDTAANKFAELASKLEKLKLKSNV